jgi:metal-responsive CopG/Arc/MetJ family transcriptional regulator
VSEREMVHVRLPKPLIKKLDHLAVELDEYRSGAIEKILQWAVVELERQGPASLVPVTQ